MTSVRLVVLVEDDTSFAQTLKRAFERRGYQALVAKGYDDLVALLADHCPGYAVVDLKLVGQSGLTCVKTLRVHNPAMAIVVLTGYVSIATAVEAIKLGACDYLAKPSDINDIEKSFSKVNGDPGVEIATENRSINIVEWEHIHQALLDSNFNISATARLLGMHRRTLARKLKKMPL